MLKWNWGLDNIFQSGIVLYAIVYFTLTRTNSSSKQILRVDYVISLEQRRTKWWIMFVSCMFLVLFGRVILKEKISESLIRGNIKKKDVVVSRYNREKCGKRVKVLLFIYGMKTHARGFGHWWNAHADIDAYIKCAFQSVCQFPQPSCSHVGACPCWLVKGWVRFLCHAI